MSGVLVVIRESADREAWLTALTATGLAFTEFDALHRIFRVDGVTPATFPLRRSRMVVSVEPDDLPIRGAEQALAIDAALSGASWGIARVIRRRPPWPVTRLQFPRTTYFRCERDGTGVDIYSIDSGVLATHDEFTGRVTNVYGGTDQYEHGTFVMGCAAGATVGIARGALIFSFRVLDSSGAGTNTDLINGLNAALSHYTGRAGTNRPAVVNMSLVGASSTINSAVSSLISAGMVVVACAGNVKQDLGTVNAFPAESDPDILVIGGIGPADLPYYAHAGGSNYGTRVDVNAPSQALYACGISSDSAYVTGPNGTSFGTGYASGVVACLLQGHPRLTTRAKVQAVRAHVLSTATTGRLRSAPSLGLTLPDRLLYLDPNQTAPETIAGLA